MNETRTTSICVALLAAIVTASIVTAAACPAWAADEKEQALIDIVRSDSSPKAEKAITCKRLAVFGTKDAVPALAALLPDAELTSWARIALEAIPGPEADAALRDALDAVEGRTLVGVINSIAVRGDAAAVDGLTEKLSDADTSVADAAAVALGKIGGASATETLEKALADGPAAVRSAAAEGCILSAEKLLAAGDAAAAAALYDNVRTAKVPRQRIIEATRGAILARKADGIELLVETLGTNDKAIFNIGVSTAREMPGAEVTKALAGQLGNVTVGRQAALIAALAVRDDEAVLPAVLGAVKDGPDNVRIAAVGILKQVGDASCVPVLLEVAAGSDANLAATATEAVEGLPGDGVDADLAARLADADGKMRRVLIEVAGRRRIEAATSALLEAADDSDAAVRSAALTALGSTVGPDDLAFLISRVVTPKNVADTPVATKALQAACIRMPDGNACAARLGIAMSGKDVSTQCAVLEILGAMGSPRALAIIGAAAKANNPEIQDVATRLLGGWMTNDAAPVLLDLAKTLDEDKYKIRAMRGYIRILRQFVIPSAERAKMCRAGLDACERDAEKRLLLEVMERYPSLDMLKVAADAAKDPALKQDAGEIVLLIAQKVGGGDVDVQALLAQLGQGPVKIEIVKATYGTDEKSKDVTALLQKSVGGFPLIVLPADSYNSAFGGDPVPGVVKQLKIEYKIDGKSGTVTLPENARILLPMPK